MYHKIGIQRLSPAQLSKLLNGHRVRVKHGSGHEIHASAEQHKKIMAAHRKGKAHTLQFDPYQIAQHQHMRHGHRKSHGEGEGMRMHPAVHHRMHHAHHGYGEGDGEGFLDMAGSVARAVAPMAIDYGANAAKRYISGHGDGLKRRGRPRKHTMARKTPKRHASMGEGRARRARRGHGEGLFGSVAHALAPVAIDYGAQALKNRLGHGDGIRRRGRKSHGEALYPAGYGEGEGTRRRGRKSHGEGPIGSILGNVAGSFLPF
jgi:hypothetical protein